MRRQGYSPGPTNVQDGLTGKSISYWCDGYMCVHCMILFIHIYKCLCVHKILQFKKWFKFFTTIRIESKCFSWQRKPYTVFCLCLWPIPLPSSALISAPATLTLLLQLAGQFAEQLEGSLIGPAFKAICALSGILQWVGSHPANQEVTGSIPSQGTCLGCGPSPQLGM